MTYTASGLLFLSGILLGMAIAYVDSYRHLDKARQDRERSN